MAGQDGGYALGVDLGTSNTIAVLRWPDGRTRPLLFDGQPIMPSGVFLDDAGRLHVGRDAQRLAQADPARYEPNPKRRIDESAVLLGDREVPTVDLLAGLLGAVARAAVEAVGFLPPAALTYPASWGARRRTVLATAVGRAGWPPADPAAAPVAGGTALVPEPVAAARYFADVLRRPVPVGSAIAVFDFGGGTLDIAVVRNEGADAAGRPRFAVIGSGGVGELGGLDLDAALVDHLGALLGPAEPAAWQRLLRPQTTTEWRDHRQLWDDVRGAKEMLSRATVAPVAVPGVEQAVHLTRDELERLANPLLRRGVFEAATVIANCGLAPDRLAGLFLVGGSSRVPLVARLLHAELGIAPTVLEQPELPVAEGALAEAAVPAGAAADEATASLAVGAVAGTVGQLAGRAAVASTSAGVAVPVSGAPVSAGPVSGGPGYPAPAGTPGSPPGNGDYSASVGPDGRPYPPTGPAARGWRRRRAVWIGAGAVLALAGVVTAAVLYLTRDGYADVAFRPFTDLGRIAAGPERPQYVDTAVVGDRAYVAYQGEDDRLEVAAVDAGSAKQLWRVQTAGASENWAGLTALPNALAVFADESADSEPREMVVLDPANGGKRWNRYLLGKDRVYFFADTVVIQEDSPARLLGLNLLTGRQKWELANPKDQYGGTDAAVYPVTTPEDLGGPADASGTPNAPDRGDDQRLVQITADRVARVIDARTGTQLKQRANVADPDDLVAAHDGQLYVAAADGGYRLGSYDLEVMGELRNLYSAADDQRRAEALVPCGKQRVCLLETANFDRKSTELVMVDADQGGVAWRKPAPEAQVVVPVGEHVLVRGAAGDGVSTVFDRDGGKLLSRDGVAVRVNGGNLLVFAASLSTSTGDPSVAGLPVSSGRLVELGQLKEVRSASCSWNTAVIVCAADEDFVLRRFAER